MALFWRNLCIRANVCDASKDYADKSLPFLFVERLARHSHWLYLYTTHQTL